MLKLILSVIVCFWGIQLLAQPQVRTFPAIQVTEIQLENGLKVWLKPTQFEKSEVLGKVIAWGGRDSLPLPQRKAAEYCPLVAWESGIKEQTTEKIVVYLYENVIEFVPRIDKQTRVIDASALPSTLPRLLELIALWFKEVETTQKGLEAASSYLPIRALALDDLKAAFNPAFKYPHEFTCIFVGDFSFDQDLIDEIILYLGSIPVREGNSIYSIGCPSSDLVESSLHELATVEAYWWKDNAFWEGVLGQYALWGRSPADICCGSSYYR